MSRQLARKKSPPARRSRKRVRPRPVGPPPGCALGRYAVVIFWSDEDESFIVDLPDFGMCSAFGDTPEEALAEIQVAMTGSLEVAREHQMLIPRPSFGPSVWNWSR